MATKPQAAFDRIAAANNNAYNAATNPGGLADGGHRQNFVPDLQAVADIGTYAGQLASELAGSTDAAAASAQSASNSAASANAAADRAAVFDPNNYATKASPTFTGDPRAPTPATTDNDTSIATTAFVKLAIGAAALAKASRAEVQALTNDTKFTTPKAMADAMAFVTEAAIATITPDLAAGFNRAYTMGLNATLGQPANMKDGLPIVFYFTQDGTGSRTLAFASTYHKFPNGIVPTLSTAANAVDRLSGICRNRGGTLVVEWSTLERDIR